MPEDDLERLGMMSAIMVGGKAIQAMFLRRGYRAEMLRPEAISIALGMTYVGSVRVRIPDISVEHQFNYNLVSMLDVEDWIDHELGHGQHHVACRQCATPILLTIARRGTDLVTEYRPVRTGPQSAPILTCPNCGEVLSLATVRKFEDWKGGFGTVEEGNIVPMWDHIKARLKLEERLIDMPNLSDRQVASLLMASQRRFRENCSNPVVQGLLQFIEYTLCSPLNEVLSWLIKYTEEDEKAFLLHLRDGRRYIGTLAPGSVAHLYHVRRWRDLDELEQAVQP